MVIIEFGLEFSVKLLSLKYTAPGARWGRQGTRLISKLLESRSLHSPNDHKD